MLKVRICEVILIRRIIQKLRAIEALPIKLYCDNKAIVSIAHNLVLHDRTKHVEVDKHFIKEKIGGTICTIYIPSGQQVNDLLIKGLPKGHFEFLISKLGVRYFQTSLRGSVGKSLI